MSDFIYRIIPDDPNFVFEQQADRIIEYLNEKIQAERITFIDHGKISFIDCGGELESITCPICGNNIEFDWWGKAMSISAQDGFSDFSVTLPCCGQAASLNCLKYDRPCGFARNEIKLANPSLPFDKIPLEELETILGQRLKLIIAR